MYITFPAADVYKHGTPKRSCAETSGRQRRGRFPSP